MSTSVEGKRPRSWRRATVAASIALPVVLSACGSTSTHSSAPSAASLYQRLVAGYVDFARCARSHGMASLPDPQVDDQGNDRYPALDRQGPWRWPQSVITGCAKVWERVHAIRDAYDSAHPQGPSLSTASHEQQLAFARCIRTHGFPTFPDPISNGSYSVQATPSGFAKPNLSPEARAAVDACGRRRSK